MLDTLALVLGVLVGLAAFSSWVYAVWHWTRALRHRLSDVSLSTLVFNGLKSFDVANFEAAGHQHVRAMTRGFVAFFLSVLAGAGIVALQVALRG